MVTRKKHTKRELKRAFLARGKEVLIKEVCQEIDLCHELILKDIENTSRMIQDIERGVFELVDPILELSKQRTKERILSFIHGGAPAQSETG